MINLSLQRHALFALLAAALFGASPPLAKLLVGELSPMVLAGLLYLGSGLGLCVVWLARELRGGARTAPVSAAPLQRGDYPWLAGAILSGGVLAPVLLMWGLSGADAASASLLLSAEGVMTTLLAVVFFREAVGGRVWLACLVMLAGGVLLSHDADGAWGFSPHALAVLGACVLWGLDNNLTRHISSGDAVVIAMIKGLAAGSINLFLGMALASGGALLSLGPVAAALGLGAVSYGASLVLYVLALRHLGSARTAAHFGTAPFIGAGLSVLLLGEPLTVMLLVAVALMAAATWLVLTERHAHEHGHAVLQHVHEHVHDEHHRHSHGEEAGAGPHTHAHGHAPLSHSHAHLPDIHHRHGH